MDIVICIVIGLATGVIAALCGVGGGVIMVPAFVFFMKLDQKSAVATSLAAIILTSLAASLRNSGASLIDWRTAIVTGLAAGVVAWFASGWLKSLSNPALARLFAVFLIIMGFYLLWSSTRTPAPKTGASIAATRSDAVEK
jgi:uncharacterized membrane protein YfcA